MVPGTPEGFQPFHIYQSFCEDVSFQLSASHKSNAVHLSHQDDMRSFLVILREPEATEESLNRRFFAFFSENAVDVGG